MNYNKLTTDELIEKIIKEVGLPLPTYDYNRYMKYISEVPQNIPLGGGVIGIENSDMHDTFRDACIRIIMWYDRTMK